MTKKLAIIVGSIRKDSINLKLAHALAKLGEANFTSHIVRIDDLPLYNQDHEANLPAAVVRMKDEVKSADAVLVLTPEYNRSFSGSLKNALDWLSRPYGQNSLAGKPSAIGGASPGAIGTAAAQQHLRPLMVGLGTTLMGQPELYLHYTPDLIDDSHNVTVDGTRDFLQKYMDTFAKWTAKHG